MDHATFDRLLAAARSVAAGQDTTALTAELDERRAVSTDPWATGALGLVSAIAKQCVADQSVPAAEAIEAALILRQTDDVALAAYAAAAAAVMSYRAGSVSDAVDQAVSALVLLPDSHPEAPHVLSATNALAQLFLQLSAFDLALDMAEHAFHHSVALPRTVRGHYSYAAAMVAIEALHAPASEQRQRSRALVTASIDYGLEDEAGPLGHLITSGFVAELAVFDDRQAVVEEVASHLPVSSADDPPLYAQLGERLVPPHRMARGLLAVRWHDPNVGVELLSLAIAGLEAIGDEHRVARGLAALARTRAQLGDDAGALHDALDLAERARRWQIGHIGRLADQITQRAASERARAQLADQAAIDPVTGVGSRRWIEAKTSERESAAEPGQEIAVLMIDLDHFKSVNDTYGHDIGDRVLAAVGRSLLDALRGADIVGRYGGEEFMVILDLAGGSTDVARITAERLRATIAAHPWWRLVDGLHVTTSIGLAIGQSDQIRSLIVAADRALYEAKRAGRNQVAAAGVDPEIVASNAQ